MDQLIQYIKDFMGAMSWQALVFLFLLLFWKRFVLLITAITNKLERPGEFSISKDGFSIKEYVDQKLEEKQNETITLITETGVGKEAKPVNEKKTSLDTIKNLLPDEFSEFRHRISTHLEESKARVDAEDEDPLKKSWEGKPEDKNRRLSAKITPIPYSSLFKIHLQVESTSRQDPLLGSVIFHLHPSFRQPHREVPVVNGKAELLLISYGSFTIGAETDKGKRKLKLDLAEDVKGVSEEFKKQ